MASVTLAGVRKVFPNGFEAIRGLDGLLVLGVVLHQQREMTQVDVRRRYLAPEQARV